jgi:hypothetical protein
MQFPLHTWLQQELEGLAHDEGPGEGVTLENATKCRGWSDELQERHAGDCPPDDSHLHHVSEGLDLGSGVDQLFANATIQRNKTAVVALTSNRDTQLPDHIAQVWRAGDEGIRVHLGVLPPAGTVHQEAKKDAASLEMAQIEDLMTAVLRTRGTYSILHSQDSVPRFLDHVVSRGLTQYDNADDTATLLVPGISICDYVTPEAEPRRYSVSTYASDNMAVAVAPITSNLALRVSVRHVRSNRAVRELNIGLGGNATFRAELSLADVPRTDAWFELEVEHVAGDGLAGGGLFQVSIETEAPAPPTSPDRGHDEL